MSSDMTRKSMMEEISNQRFSRDLIAIHTSEKDNILSPCDIVEGNHIRQHPRLADNFKEMSSLSRETNAALADLKVLRKTFQEYLLGDNKIFSFEFIQSILHHIFIFSL